MIPEEKLLKILDACLNISQKSLAAIGSGKGTQAAEPTLVEAYTSLIQDLHSEKKNDTILADETWEWIWKIQPGLNPIQIYGRLAWINYTILDLL